jgi:hypothetical protein
VNDKLKSETVAFVLLLIAFPVISAGATDDRTWLWVLGLVAVVIGGVLPVWTRFMDHSGDKPTDMGMEFDDRAS